MLTASVTAALQELNGDVLFAKEPFFWIVDSVDRNRQETWGDRGGKTCNRVHKLELNWGRCGYVIFCTACLEFAE